MNFLLGSSTMLVTSLMLYNVPTDVLRLLINLDVSRIILS